MLNFEVSDNGNEPLVLLHGFMENLSIWNDLEPQLSKKFTLVKIDLPGHGQSDTLGEIHTMERMAEEVKKVVDDLGFQKNIHILGHSMGGYVALAFAEKYPQYLKTLTLFFSTYFPDDEEKKEQRKRSLPVIQEAFPHYVNAGIPNLFNPDELDILEGKINLAKEIALATDNAGAMACVKGMIERPDRRAVLDHPEIKFLILAGKHDNAVKTETVISHLPKSTQIKSYILDCGHNGHWEKPEICAAILNTELLHNLPKNLVF